MPPDVPPGRPPKRIRKAYDEDPLLRAKLNEAAGKVYDSIERQMEIATRGWDAKVEKVKTDESAKKALAKEYQKLFEDQVDLAVKAAQKNTEAVWTELVRTKKDYAKYKWKAGIKVSLGAAGVITTVAIMASGGATFGATAIPGILGVIRSTSQLAQQCKALYDELETTVKQLNKNLAKVQATYQDASKAKVAAVEIERDARLEGAHRRAAEHQALPGPARPRPQQVRRRRGEVARHRQEARDGAEGRRRDREEVRRQEQAEARRHLDQDQHADHRHPGPG